MAESTRIRQLNRQAVVEHLLSAATAMATRSAIARATGLSQPTVGKIVDDLLAERVVQNVDAAPAAAGRMGRPGLDVTLDRSRPRFLAVQLGATHTRLAGLAVGPPPRDEWDRTFATPRSLRAWGKAIKAAAAGIVDRKFRAALVSAPGVLDDATGRSILSPNLPWLQGRDLRAIVEDATGLPTHVVQEIRCLALGHCAIDRAADSFLLVDVGTGIGSAAVFNGRLMEGQSPLGGELGHTRVVGNRRPCGCGGVGCLETIVSRGALLALLGAHASAGDADGPGPNGRRSVPPEFNRAMEAAAAGIAGTLNVLGLSRVVLTGFLAELPDGAIARLRTQIQETAIAGRFGAVETITAPRRRLAGLARVAIDRIIAPS